MSAETDSVKHHQFPEARLRRRWAILAALLVLITAGVTVALAWPLHHGRGSSGSITDNRAATSLATVQRRTLGTQTQFNGTLGYADSYQILGRRAGTVTWLPEPGQVIGNGQVLYRVDGAPIVLLCGSTPAYRALAAGATATDVTGSDVAELNHDLVRLGYMRKADVDAAWAQFGWATSRGVERLQNRLGIEPTGRLDLGTAVFLPSAARVTTLTATLGGPASGAVLTATSPNRTVSVALAADRQSAVKAGDHVMIALPDNSSTPGRVTSVGTVATVPPNGGSGSSGPVVPVTITPTDGSATAGLDQAPVLVSITDRTVSNVLAAPVTALLALAGGGYAVEVVASDGTHHLQPVTPGLFDDAAGLVQVSGSGLTGGQRVVVPGS